MKRETASERALASLIPRGVVPTTLSLGGFLELSQRLENIDVETVPPLTPITVETMNSTYHVTLVDPGRGEILIQGGSRWPITIRAQLLGASLGGGFLWLRRLVPGMRMEIVVATRRFVTTPVLRVSFEKNSSVSRPA